MKRVIVTGALGFIGSNLIKELIDNDIEVIAIARKPQTKNIISPKINYVYCDIRNTKLLKEKLKNVQADIFYHLAWFGLKDGGLVDYNVQIEALENTLQLIELAAELGCKKFIGMGSISQYELIYCKGQSSIGDKHCVYKVSKLASELMGRHVAKMNNIDFIWPIITNIYGVGEKSNRLINSLLRELINDQDFALSEGTQIYDFIYITDACRALRLLGEYGRNDREYVIGSGGAKQLKYFLKKIPELIGSKGKLHFGERKNTSFSLPEECFDCDTLMQDTGFKPKVDFNDGIKKTAVWLRNKNE